MIIAKMRPYTNMPPTRELAWDWVALLAAAIFTTIDQWYLTAPLFDRLSHIESLKIYQDSALLLPKPVVFILYLVILDFFNYWFHRSAHSRFLWETHAWHHSSKSIYFISGLRSSFFHVVWFNIPNTLAFIILPIDKFATVFLGFQILQICNLHYTHSNIRLPYQKILEKVIVTPRVHLVHHLSDPKYTNSNYCFFFTFWDRLFGTYTDPDTVEDGVPFGLDYEESNVNLLLGLPRVDRWFKKPTS
ncbi:sterol desaturase family protein [Pseudobacteriovorax antillogorgiicola]|uniref:sterol desaturase family protein n=1 Tax=Pseudobacteriovorax antillogorgiicola TaxID=1513793 RepID=UPI0010446159|nr:sterol desaturase family protein [Pseudobacteriovorax antillogorgiicola]